MEQIKKHGWLVLILPFFIISITSLTGVISSSRPTIIEDSKGNKTECKQITSIDYMGDGINRYWCGSLSNFDDSIGKYRIGDIICPRVIEK